MQAASFLRRPSLAYLLLTVSLHHHILRGRHKVFFLFNLQAFGDLLEGVVAEVRIRLATVAHNLICEGRYSY